jgi:hypothetical protein
MNRFALALLALMQMTTSSAQLNLDPFEKEGDEFQLEIARKVGAAVETWPEPPTTCLERIRSLVLSDRVGFIFNVAAVREGDRLVLSGEAERPEFRDITCGVLRHLGYTSIVDRIRILPDLNTDPAPFAVTVKPAVMAWSRPDLTGIPMDESLLGEPVYIFQELPGVFLIKNFSGYWGYASRNDFRRVSKAQFIRLINEPKAQLTADFKAGDTLVPAGCRLLIKEWRSRGTCVLLGPSGQNLEVPRTLCQKSGREPAMARVVVQARGFLNRPYNMGGKSCGSGIDCSGLVQMACRRIGLNLARDAKQQYLNGNLLLPCVAEALLPGDAIFFMNDAGQVNHTALYLGERKIIHATSNEVKVQSMDPTAKDYFKRFNHDFIGAKRYWW